MLKRTALAAGVLTFSTQTLADGHATQIVTSHHSILLTQVAAPLEHPWGLDWLPDGRILVTERTGALRIVSDQGDISAPLAGLPEITSDFRDGLLDVAVSPSFDSDRMIYFTYSALENDQRWLVLSSAELHEDGLQKVQSIFEADVKVDKDQGFGSRIRFADDGSMYVTVGDHAEAANAQDPANALGTIIRLMPDGLNHPNNPFASDEGKHNAIYAYGFKNPQGLAIHPETRAIWAIDHGAGGGGEINAIEAGGNYGWPDRTFGDRNDAPGAPQTDVGDFVEPAFTWGVAPTVALSGLSFYTGSDFPAWDNDLFTGSLTQEALIRVSLDDDGAVHGTEYVIWEEIGRIRDVRQGPDGKLYVLNDDPEGGIYRIDPVE